VRTCLNCSGELKGPDWSCPSCGFAPRRESGYLAFTSSRPDDAFVPEAFEWLAKAEEGFWWFDARNELIAWAVEKWCRNARNILEIGCGTGVVAANIARRFPWLEVSVAELFAEALPFVSRRIPAATVYQLDARAMPFRAEFDVIGAFDVIEHIDEDEKVLAAMHRALVPGGIVLITVPQHPFLWSRFDAYGHHKRRYTRRELSIKLGAAGFDVLDMRSFVSLLMPLQLAARLIPSSRDYDPQNEFRISPVVNTLLKKVMNVEVALVRSGLSFPFGGSLLAVARAV